MISIEDMQDDPFPERCGHYPSEAYALPVPLPKADEMVHATEGKSVLFIWRDRWYDHEKDEPALDKRRVCLARMDLGGPGNNARILDLSTFAIDNPTWVSSIVKAMGFDYETARFGSMLPHQVPVDLWETLRQAVFNRVNNTSGDKTETVSNDVNEYVGRLKN